MKFLLLPVALCGLAFFPGVFSETPPCLCVIPKSSSTAGAYWGTEAECQRRNYECKKPTDPEYIASEDTSSTSSTDNGSKLTNTDPSAIKTSSPQQSQQPQQSQSSPPTASQESDPSSESKPSPPPANKLNSNKVGPIVGGVVGGVFLIAALIGLIFILCIRKRKRDSLPHREPHDVLEKTRTPSPRSHISPGYINIPPPPPGPPPPLQGPPPAHFANSAPIPHQSQLQHPPPPPPPPIQEPIELLSREVDEDGVSVSSLDLHRPSDARSVPRLPVYHRESGASPTANRL